jgi:hypothetical protein
VRAASPETASAPHGPRRSVRGRLRNEPGPRCGRGATYTVRLIVTISPVTSAPGLASLARQEPPPSPDKTVQEPGASPASRGLQLNIEPGKRLSRTPPTSFTAGMRLLPSRPVGRGATAASRAQPSTTRQRKGGRDWRRAASRWGRSRRLRTRLGEGRRRPALRAEPYSASAAEVCQDCMKASGSALIVSACVVGMPCGKPW